MTMSQEFLIVRGSDHVVLGVRWSGFDLQLGSVETGGRPRMIATTDAARIVLTFPPQSIAEEKLTKGAFQLRRARLAGPSRIEFVVEAGTAMDLGAEGILETLIAAGQSIVSTGNGPEDPTAIELPWGLVVSAQAQSGNARVVSDHSPRPVVSPGGVNGLWSARLRATDGSATDARLSLLPLHLHPDPDDTTLNLSPLSAGDRQSIISESASSLAQVRRLELSALGGSFSARSIWSNFEWDHDTTLGRDQRVRVLVKGVLYPFGHRAEFQTFTERVMDPAGQATPTDPPAFAIAGMLKDTFLVITEPVRRAVNEERLAREFPFAEVEILTRSFRDIIEPRTDTTNPWDWETYQREPFAPDAIQTALDEVNAEVATLTEQVTQFLEGLPQNFQQMIDQQFGSAPDFLTAQQNLAESGDPDAMRNENTDINKAIDRLQASFVPETTTGPDGETIVDEGAVEANRITQEAITEAISHLHSAGEIATAAANQAFWTRETQRLQTAVQSELDNLPRDIETLAGRDDESSKRILELRAKRVEIQGKLDAFIFAKQEKHPLFFTPHTGDGKPLLFPVRCPNAVGDVTFSLPLIFVSDMHFERDDDFPEFASLTDFGVTERLNIVWQARNAVPLPGVRLNPLQRAPLTPPQPADIQEVHQLTIAGHPHDGTFRPSLSDFLVELPTLRALLPNQPERVALKLTDEFLNVGPSIDLALAPVKAIGIDFTDLPERSGGLISPKFAADVISRELGPVAKGALPNIGVPDLSSVYKDATLLGFPLAKLIKLDAPEGLPKPPKIVPIMENGLPAGALMEWNDIKLDNHGPLQVTNDTKFKLTVESSKAKTETKCTVSSFALVLPPTGTELLKLTFKSIVFTQQVGRPPDLEVNGLGVEFKGALKLLKDLQDKLMPFIGLSGPKPKIDVATTGITASYILSLPSVSAGAFLLRNIAILIGVEVPFTKKPVTVSLGFASRENPFNLSVLMFGGGGYIEMQIGGEGITRLEASLEFGAMIAIDLIVASGEVHALGGVHFLKDPNGSISLEAYIRIGGSVEVLGLVSVSVELVVNLTFESIPPTVAGGAERNRLVGRATLVIEVDVTLFSESVSLDSGEWELIGSDTPAAQPAVGPLFLGVADEDAGLAAWRQSRRAFAEAKP
jgi:hypothetical protein